MGGVQFVVKHLSDWTVFCSIKGGKKQENINLIFTENDVPKNQLNNISIYLGYFSVHE